jgi:arylsulfatase A-like enzyme
MKRLHTLIVAAIVATLLLTASATAQKAKRAVIISLDGLDTRYVTDPDKYGLKIPTLRKLMANGVTAKGVYSVYPSVTYPNHASMITGTVPARHGILGNNIIEPPDVKSSGAWYWYAKDITADTLWAAAKRKGKTVGLVSWPVAVGVGDWNIPEIFAAGGNREETKKVVSAHSLPAGLLEEMEKNIPELFAKDNKDEGDNSRSLMAEYIIRQKRPDVMLVHLYDLDHFEHDFGPFAPKVHAILEKVDGYVARLVGAVDDETAIFIVSDHGFLPVTKNFRPGVLLQRAGLVTYKTENGRDVITDWKAMAYVSSASAAIILKDPNDRETLKKVREIFEPLAGKPDSGLYQVLDAAALKKLGANPKAAIMLDPADGFSMGGGYFGEPITNTGSRGTHGYVPTRADFFASFIASGAGVTRRGRMTEYSAMLDVGVTIASALGLKLNDATGKAVNLRR